MVFILLISLKSDKDKGLFSASVPGAFIWRNMVVIEPPIAVELTGFAHYASSHKLATFLKEFLVRKSGNCIYGRLSEWPEPLDTYGGALISDNMVNMICKILVHAINKSHSVCNDTVS